MEGLLDPPPTHRVPGILLLGDSNSGKTSLGLEFMSRHPVDPNPEGEAVRMPVLRIEIPPNPDGPRIYDEILMRLMQPLRSKDPLSVKARQVRTILQIVGTRMLIFDEFQAVLSTRNDRRRLVLEVVKHLGNTPRFLSWQSAFEQAIDTRRQQVRLGDETAARYQRSKQCQLHEHGASTGCRYAGGLIQLVLLRLVDLSIPA